MDNISQIIDSILSQEEKLLVNALATAAKAYRDNPTEANLKAYKAAKKALEEYRSKGNGEKFHSLMEVLQYLKQEGWKISRSKLYEKAYLLKKQPDGTYLKKDVDNFARIHLKMLDGSDIEAGALRKLEAEIRKLTAEAEKREIEVARLRGELVSKHEVEQQLAARAIFLKDRLRNFFHGQVPAIVEMVKEGKEVNEIIDYINNELEDMFDYYSKPMEIKVLLDEGGNGDG